MYQPGHTAPVLQGLLDEVEGHVSALVGGEVGRLLGGCGLAEIRERLRLYQQQQAGQQGQGSGEDGTTAPAETAAGMAAADPALALPAVVEALRAFFVLVSSPEALPEFHAIQVRLDTCAGCSRSMHAQCRYLTLCIGLVCAEHGAGVA